MLPLAHSTSRCRTFRARWSSEWEQQPVRTRFRLPLIVATTRSDPFGAACLPPWRPHLALVRRNILAEDLILEPGQTSHGPGMWTVKTWRKMWWGRIQHKQEKRYWEFMRLGLARRRGFASCKLLVLGAKISPCSTRRISIPRKWHRQKVIRRRQAPS